jgi:methyltransferase (TIGR00027 family)
VKGAACRARVIGVLATGAPRCARPRQVNRAFVWQITRRAAGYAPLDPRPLTEVELAESSTQATAKTGVTYAPSETALATAMMRALAARDPREEVRGPDTLAELFLTDEQKALLRDQRARDWVMKNKVTPGAYEFMIARTAFFDNVVQKELAADVPQIVILGAGYDSRPYRFAHLLGDARVFELDASPTQERKKEMLERGGVRVPANVRFVPIDFAADDLEASLVAAGFSREKAALFLWEGVTYYLTKDAVDKTLGAVKTLSTVGSSISFDVASLSPEALREDGIKKLRQQMSTSASAEPTRFGIPHGRLEAFLAKRGFAIQELVSPENMQTRYLTLQDGSAIGMVPALFYLVHACAA